MAKTELCQGKPILPISIMSAITVDTMARSHGKYQSSDLDKLPHYIRIEYEKMIKVKGQTGGQPVVVPPMSLAARSLLEQRADAVASAATATLKLNPDLNKRF